MRPRPPRSPLFPYTTLFRSQACFVGVNATLRNSITIGARTLIGAGAAVMKDTEPIKRSEEHTSELQSPVHLVCRLLLEKKNSPRGFPRAPSAEPHDDACGSS